ncbi:PIN domain-containing protein [Hippea alviniae]|uniref:PIN domain-containing protein n=1 Tax=Hippea alviniae TaxID=1279027 RepID=UPI0003B65F08|nr:PIN domain-containing protein [Hippea alviniae]
MIILDANIVIRFLMNDNVEQANKTEEIIKNNTVYIPNEVLAEIVYVLIGVYKIPRKDTADTLLLLVRSPNVFISGKSKVINALETFKNTNLDFVDSLLCSYSDTDVIATFDKKLKSCIKNRKGNLWDM